MVFGTRLAFPGEKVARGKRRKRKAPTVHRHVHIHNVHVHLMPVKGYSKKADKRYAAKRPGRRTSATGNTYYEYRVNRADLNRKKRL